MDRKQYTREVKRRLKLDRTDREAVLRDLDEIFETARQQGEQDDAVIARLGEPAAFAASFGVSKGWKWKRALWWVVTAAAVVLLLAALALAIGQHQAMTASVGIIGGADGPTAILVSGGIDPVLLLLGAGLLAAVVSVLIRWLMRR